MNTRKRFLALACLPLIALGACGQQDEPQTEPSTSHSSSSTTAKPSDSKSPEPTTSSSQPGTSATEVAPEPAAAAPYVVECLEGVPGPAQWSDGTMRFSQDCYDQGVANRGAYQCPGTDAFFDDPADCNSANLGGDPAYDTMYPGGLPPSDPPRADDCVGPAAVCGYYDENGNPINFNKLTGESTPR